MLSKIHGLLVEQPMTLESIMQAAGVSDIVALTMIVEMSERGIVEHKGQGKYGVVTHKGNAHAELMTTKRKVRKDFDLTKNYSVDVSECTEEEKKEVQQGFFDVGITWLSEFKTHGHLNAKQYSNTCESGKVVAYLLYCTTTEGCNMTPEEFLELVYEPENKGHDLKSLLDFVQDDAVAATYQSLGQYRTKLIKIINYFLENGNHG